MDKLHHALASKDEAAFQAELDRRISAIKADTSPSNVAGHNAEVNALLTALRQGKSLVPAFSLKRYTEDLEASRISRGPGSFSFAGPTALKPAAAITQKVPEPIATEETIEWTIHDLSNQRIEHVCQGSLVSVNNLENCILVVPNEAPAISLNNLRKCVVIAEKVTGSARITAVHETKVALAAKQLRIHDSMQTDFYIAVFGNPIIENCTGLRFAPLRGADSGPWDNVKDFNCPTTSEASPNWSVLPEAERSIPRPG
jgi:UDP-N-acetylglucosamine transferase subunit ALG13